MRFTRLVLTMLMLATASACTVAERLSEVGQPPPLSPIADPAGEPRYTPVSLPMPAPEPPVSAGANSLWRNGARGFFRDQRARRVGDILTVEVTITDQASLTSESSRARDNNDALGISALFGYETKYDKIFPSAVNPQSLVAADSTMNNAGRGETDREEKIDFEVAAVIVQQLPNGNFVVRGRQEVRVNFEVREIVVTGIVRPEDISPRNTIGHQQIAELRVAYGGRGQITDVQQPRYGAQVLDIILPY